MNPRSSEDCRESIWSEKTGPVSELPTRPSLHAISSTSDPAQSSRISAFLWVRVLMLYAQLPGGAGFSRVVYPESFVLPEI
jgi:hypothetical protein